MPLNHQKDENDCRNDFMINLHECYEVKLGFELAIPGSGVRLTKTALQNMAEGPD